MASSSHIKPNEKGMITMNVDTAQKKGVLIKTAEVLSNDPQRPKVTLTLKAEVNQPVSSVTPR